MAEGFISSTSSEMLEDLSYSCMLKAKEENFFHVVNSFTGMRTPQTQAGRVRRLAVRADKVDQLVPPTRDRHLRSLLYFSRTYHWQIRNKEVIQSAFNDFKLLRVLKLEEMRGLKTLPSTVGNLVHLRFLSLKDSSVQQLPSSIGNLVCLQTLYLRVLTFPIYIKISNVFKKMEQLRHLYLPVCQRWQSVRGKLSFGNLQTLVNVNCRGLDSKALVELSNLRKLHIMGISDSKHWKKLDEVVKSSSLTLHHLRSLSLRTYHYSQDILLSRCRSIYKLQLIGRAEKLPEDLLSFPNLIKLSLVDTRLKEDQIKFIEKLPHLRKLLLEDEAFSILPSHTLVCTNGGFPNLEFLILVCSPPEVKEWRVEKGAMPRLRRLSIGFCKALTAAPDGLQYVATLKELTISHMPSEFCNRLGEGGEDFDKIEHVPSVLIKGTERRDLWDKRAKRRPNKASRCMTQLRSTYYAQCQ